MQYFYVVLFWLSLILLVNSYVVYPIIVFIRATFFKNDFEFDEDFTPEISILISAYNEEKVLRQTIQSLQLIDYPNEKIEILVGSDCSNDSTNSIMSELAKQYSNIKFFPFNERRGKASVLNNLVREAKGKILFFCDANTLYSSGAVKKMVRFYIDKRIGGVSGKLLLKDIDGNNSGVQEKKYWNLETRLKQLEGKFGMLIGANGGIYSIWKYLFTELPSDIPVMDDLIISLKILECNKKFLYEPEAIAQEFVGPSLKSEFNRKVRNSAISLSSIRYFKNLLSPNYGFISYALWSHKILRWFSPVFLINILVTSIILYESDSFFRFSFYFQLVFYLSALLGYLFYLFRIRITIFLLPLYFVLTNVALLIGLIKFIFNKHTSFWNSTPRQI